MSFTLYCATQRGDKRNTLYPRRRVITGFSDLQTAARFDHVAAEFEGSRRSLDGFKLADCIVLDVDNDHGQIVQPEQIAKDFPGVAHMIVFSRHDMQPKGSSPAVPRFHVYFPIKPTADRAEVEQLKRSVCAAFPYFDGNAIDAARFLFGVPEPQGFAVEGALLLTDLFPCADEKGAEGSAAALQEIPEGQRNSVLSRFAFQLLKRLGDTEEARAEFDRRAGACTPPLEDSELSTIWGAAVAAYRRKIETRPDYLTPEEYALQGLQPLPGGSLRPLDFSNVGQARVFTTDTAGQVLFSEGTGWLCWDGHKFAQSEAAVHLRFHDLTDRQLIEARNDVHAAVDALADADEIAAGEAKRQQAAARAYLKFVQQQRNAGGIKAALGEAAHIVTVGVDELDADPFLLNTPGGVVDLRTGQTRPNDPADRCTKCTAVAPSDKGAALWAEFVNRFACGDRELIDYLQQVAGMAAVGRVFSENLLILYGTGGNAKSTFVNALARVLGDYSGSLSTDVLLSRPGQNKGPELAALRGLRLAVASEIEEGARLDEAILKRLCSTDSISANPKYRDPFTFTPSHSLIMCTNHLPRVGSMDSGTWSRIAVVPCRGNFRGQRGEVKDYCSFLVENAGGAVLAWMIAGAEKFIANGCALTPPQCVVDEVQKYRAESDWLGRFLADECEIGKGYTVKGCDLQAAYAQYCDINGDYRRHPSDFKAAMEAAGFGWHKTRVGAVYYGLRLGVETL